MRETTQVHTFSDIDYSMFKFPHIVVYQNPTDFPGMFVARLFDLDGPRPQVIIREDLHDIRGAIPPRFHWMDRNPADDPVILEVWI